VTVRFSAPNGPGNFSATLGVFATNGFPTVATTSLSASSK
jgi:hypothetical protein